jgi:uncharacterized protein (TIGR00251 family)
MTKTNKPTESPLQPVNGGVELPVLVVPRSSRNAVAGLQDTRLKLKISKPPVDGQANAACCRLLADLFETPASKVSVVRGHNSRRKTIRLEGLTPEQAREVLKKTIED